MNTMNMPGFTAAASLGRSSNAYIGAFGPGGWRRGAIVPAIDSACAGINCDAVLASAILLFNPVSWGWYQRCCTGGPQVNDFCTANPCLEECRYLGLCPIPPTIPAALISAEFSDLSSQITTLRNELKRQLYRIERCACGPLTYTGPLPQA